MDRQLEFELKKELSTYVENTVNEKLDIYVQKYQNHIGFLLYYPMIKIESRFIEVDPFHGAAVKDREILSWFIRKILSRTSIDNLNFKFINDEYREFEKMYDDVKKLYHDVQFAKNVKYMSSIAKYRMMELSPNTYEVTSPYIIDKYDPQKMYYQITHNQAMEVKGKEVAQSIIDYLVQNYRVFNRVGMNLIRNPKGFQRARRLMIEIDSKLMDLCINRVNYDLSNLSGELSSTIIHNHDDMVKVWAFLYYISTVHEFILKAKRFINEFRIEDVVITIGKQWLVGKIQKVFRIDTNKIERIIDYLLLDPQFEGSFAEFPLVEMERGGIIFLATSFMLNDPHMNIVNGHYLKNVQFETRNESISNSVVDAIVSGVSNFSNILVSSEYYYELEGEVDENGERPRSDIDIALYDVQNNKLLIIECKWFDKVFVPNENYRKIENVVKEIYTEQLNKHKRYLEIGKANIDSLFNQDPNVVGISSNVEIYYIAVDKRVQFHTDQWHLIPLYMLLTLFHRHYAQKNYLDLEGFINEISGLRTNAEYEMLEVGVEKVEINGKTFISDSFYLGYDYV